MATASSIATGVVVNDDANDGEADVVVVDAYGDLPTIASFIASGAVDTKNIVTGAVVKNKVLCHCETLSLNKTTTTVAATASTTGSSKTTTSSSNNNKIYWRRGIAGLIRKWKQRKYKDAEGSLDDADNLWFFFALEDPLEANDFPIDVGEQLFKTNNNEIETQATNRFPPPQLLTTSSDDNDDMIRVQKALKNYEQFYQLPKQCATLDQIVNSSAGIQGWAKMSQFK